MTWKVPKTWATGDIVLRSDMNAELRDELRAIDRLLDLVTGSFTDGGVILGSGAEVWTAMAVLAKGSLIVGDGVTDPGPLVVGSNDQLVAAASAQSLGVSWQTIGWDVAEALAYG